MSERLIAIIQELSQEENRLKEHQSKLQAQLSAVETRVNQIQEAQSALGRKPSVKAEKKRTNNRPSKPAATKGDVIFAAREVLQARDQLSEQKLKQLAEEKITASGKSRTGFALRFAEAMKEEQFRNVDNEVRLVQNSKPRIGKDTSEAFILEDTQSKVESASSASNQLSESKSGPNG